MRLRLRLKRKTREPEMQCVFSPMEVRPGLVCNLMCKEMRCILHFSLLFPHSPLLPKRKDFGSYKMLEGGKRKVEEGKSVVGKKLFGEHCYLNAAFCVDEPLCHLLYVGCGHLADHLAIVTIEVGVVVNLVPDDIAPIVVGYG